MGSKSGGAAPSCSFPVTFSDKQKVRLDRATSRVCIVGAGPGGLHMAYRLRDLGVQHVTVLDKSDRICGKVETIPHNGAVHEMGACWLSSSYDYVRALESDLGVTFDEKGIGETESRDIITDPDAYKTVDMSDWILATVKKQEMPLMPQWFIDHFPDGRAGVDAIHAFLKYERLHKELLDECHFNFPRQPAGPDDPLTKELSMPLKEWLKEKDLLILTPFMQVAQTAQGYGFIDEVPTYYALYWLTPKLIKGYLLFAGKKVMEKVNGGLLKFAGHFDFCKLMNDHFKKELDERVPPVPTLLKCGWEPLITAMDKKYNLDKILEAEVTGIERTADKVTVHYQKSGVQKGIECDLVILAAPMPQILCCLDASDHERHLFSQLRPVTISTHLIDADDPRHHERQAVVSWPFGLSKEGQGHVYSLKNSRKALCNCQKSGDNGKHSFVTYQLYNTALELNGREPPDQVTRQMLEDVQKVYGLENVTVQQRRAYHYFYHFTPEDVSHGLPWEILKMQGLNRTVYTGCSVSFESVNDIVANNEMLLNAIIKVE